MKETNLTKFGIEKYDPYTWYYVKGYTGVGWLVRGNLLNKNEIRDSFHVVIEKDGSYGYVSSGKDNIFTNNPKNINEIRLATREEIERAESYFDLKSREKIKPKEDNRISIINANQAKELYKIGFEKQKQSFMADIMYRINTVFGGGFNEVEMNVFGYNENVVEECIDELKELGYCVKKLHKLAAKEDWVIVTLSE